MKNIKICNGDVVDGVFYLKDMDPHVFSVNERGLSKPRVASFKINNPEKYRYIKPFADGKCCASNDRDAPIDEWVELETEEI